MDVQRVGGAPERKWRTGLTIGLLLVCALLASWADLDVNRDLIANTVAGLIVLACAGIWVSYFAELEAHRTVKEAASEIKGATRVSRMAAEIGVKDMFSSSEDEEYHHFIERELLMVPGGGEVRVLGVACRGFFHPDGGPNNATIKRMIIDAGVNLRAVFAHPLFEPAISRGIREDALRHKFSDYPESILVADIVASCEGTRACEDSPNCRGSIRARLCPIPLHCRLTLVNGHAIYEPHHFGTANSRASMGTPVLVFHESSEFYLRLVDHFEFLWMVSERFGVTKELVKSLRRLLCDERQEMYLVEYMKNSRPDLF